MDRILRAAVSFHPSSSPLLSPPAPPLPPPTSRGQLTLQLTHKHPALRGVQHIKHILSNLPLHSLTTNGTDDTILIPGVEAVAETGVDCWHEGDVGDAIVDDGVRKWAGGEYGVGAAQFGGEGEFSATGDVVNCLVFFVSTFFSLSFPQEWKWVHKESSLPLSLCRSKRCR